ncbi:LacI family transcriptional regulator [Streptomyces sp. NBC_00435]|uniref:LacI family DNA-binding transcriptional regulator n=1 Tax=Streptomyces sp. NBC_00435 TaxID=2903649 RepID=UPI002E21A779
MILFDLLAGRYAQRKNHEGLDVGISGEERRRLIVTVLGELGGQVRVAELAERLGIPAVTVRRDVAALADSGSVTRSHGYVSLEPSPSDRRPAGPHCTSGPTVGLLVPSVGPYFDEIIAGVRSAATAAAARLVLGITPTGARDDQAQVEQLLESGAQGLLLAPRLRPGPDDDCEWLNSLPVPTVLVERRSPTPDGPGSQLDTIGSDHRDGVFRALRHFVGLGHGSVLLAARSDSWTAAEVRAGYAEGMRLLGMEPLPVLDTLGPDGAVADPGGLARRIADAAADGVRAVLVHSDQDAIRLPPLLRVLGLRVPADVALIAYDDMFAALAAPPLTAVAPPKRAVGEAAFALLLRRLTGGPGLPAQRTSLLPALRVRTSCGG